MKGKYHQHFPKGIMSHMLVLQCTAIGPYPLSICKKLWIC